MQAVEQKRTDDSATPKPTNSPQRKHFLKRDTMTTALTTIAAPDRRPNPSKAATLAASDKTLAEIFAAIPDHQGIAGFRLEVQDRLKAARAAKVQAATERATYGRTFLAEQKLPKNISDDYRKIDDRYRSADLEVQLLTRLEDAASSQLDTLISASIDSVIASLSYELSELTSAVLEHAENVPAPFTADASYATPESQSGYLAIRSMVDRYNAIRNAQTEVVRAFWSINRHRSTG